MKTVQYKVEFFSFWHCGSGLAKGGDADATVIKDRDGLPFIPGKTIKGLLREAMETIAPDSYADAVKQMFGTPSGNSEGSNIAGCSFFSNASISGKDRKNIISQETQQYLFDHVSSTAIGQYGTAVDGSLRDIEVALPCILLGTIKDIPDEILASDGQGSSLLDKSLGFIKRLGFNRSRGLGRCRFTVFEIKDADSVFNYTGDNCNPSAGPVTLYFRCTLLSDIILTQSSATEGPQKTLDFIPGSNFMGIAANYIFSSQSYKEKAHDILFSDKVKFSDAHPVIQGYRCVRTPAAFYFPKDSRVFGKPDSPAKEVHVFHKLKESFIYKDKDGETIQLKQCRSGYIAHQNSNIYGIENFDKTFSIKSAWDRDRMATAKSQIFGYEALVAGKVMLFQVELHEESSQYADLIIRSLCGEKRIGKSKSAQYGSVLIERIEQFKGPVSQVRKAEDNIYAVYAESRLMFLDDAGFPHMNPSAEELGFSADAKILIDKSQIRTFSYSPYNSARRAYSAEYCGIEKGSVLIVKSTEPPTGNGWTGVCNNEGFGHVLYNPEFLHADENGVSAFGFVASDANTCDISNTSSDPSTIVSNFASNRKIDAEMSAATYRIVNDFLDKHKNVFKGISNSQWGQIRNIASSLENFDEVHNSILRFISNGIRKDQWRGRPAEYLEKFVAQCSELDSRHKRLSLINLSSAITK